MSTRDPTLNTEREHGRRELALAETEPFQKLPQALEEVGGHSRSADSRPKTPFLDEEGKGSVSLKEWPVPATAQAVGMSPGCPEASEDGRWRE